MHAHDLRINGSGKGTNPFLVHVSAFARIGTVLFPNHISRAERSSFLCRECCRTTWNRDLFTPTPMAPRGDALYRSLVYLAFMAGDGLDCL